MLACARSNKCCSYAASIGFHAVLKSNNSNNKRGISCTHACHCYNHNNNNNTNNSNRLNLHLHLRHARCYGIYELQQKFGSNFKNLPPLDPNQSSPLERKIHAFVKRVSKSPTFFDSVIERENEIAQANDGDQKIKPNMQRVLHKHYNWNPYHGRASAKKNKDIQSDQLECIPEEYKQSGWGMQPESRTGSPDIYKLFPNNDVLHNLMWDGQRVDEMAHLFFNPLREHGHRDASIAGGRDYNALERALAPYNENVVEQWPGMQAITDQLQNEGTPQQRQMHLEKQRIPAPSPSPSPSPSSSKSAKSAKSAKSSKSSKSSASSESDLDGMAMKQLLMRHFKEQSEQAHAERAALPPFKYGFEDVPLLVRQRNYHSPDMIGDRKRTRELVAEVSIFMKYVFPEMTEAQAIACALIGGKHQYNAQTTEMSIKCSDHYFYHENEAKIVSWITKLIFEIDRLSENIDPATGTLRADCQTWEKYQAKYARAWAEERVQYRWHKHRFQHEMRAYPPHIQSNFTLYQAGERMQKASKYADVIYDRGMVDGANILQREGPKMANALQYSEHYLPVFCDAYEYDANHNRSPCNNREYGYHFYNKKNKHFQNRYDFRKQAKELIGDAHNTLDAVLPPEPKDYILTNERFYAPHKNVYNRNNYKHKKIDFHAPPAHNHHHHHHIESESESESERGDGVGDGFDSDAHDASHATFGLRSGYQIPSSLVNEYFGSFDMPLAQPFSGLRLRKQKLTPWTNGEMMEFYRNKHQKRVAIKLVFGNPQQKNKSLDDETKIKNEKMKNEEMKRLQKKMTQGPKRERKKATLKQQALEQRLVKRKKINDKFNQKIAAKPFFNIMKNTIQKNMGSRRSEAAKAKIQDISIAVTDGGS